MTFDYVHVNEIVANIVAINQQIAVDVSGILDIPMNTIAYPYSRRKGSNYPVFLTGLSNDKADNLGIAQDQEYVVLTTELQLGKLGEGIEGALEQTLQTWIPYVIATYQARPRLMCASAPFKPPHGFLEASVRLGDTIMPGDIIGAKFVHSCVCSAYNIFKDT